MSNSELRGRFVWHELLTPDTAAAITFYSRLMPWKSEPSGMPDYTLWMAGRTRAGGLTSLPGGDAPGAPPHWMVYIGTDDVDETVATAQKLGGRVCKPAGDIPNIGRFAVLADPDGATFAVFKPAGTSEGGMPAGGVGDFSWHELTSTDLDRAFNFYSELFGWSRGAAHDMGPMGIYQIFTQGGQDAGGMYKAHDNATPPGWLGYVRVTDVDKAAAAVKSGGGRILNGPVEVPGGSWIVNLLDPQGGAIAVVEPPAAAGKPAASAKGSQKEGGAARKASQDAQEVAGGARDGSGRKTSAPSAGGSMTTEAAGSEGSKSAARKSASRKRAAGKSAARKGAAGKGAAGKRAAGKRAARKSTGKSGRQAATRKPARGAARKGGRTAAKRRSAAARTATGRKAKSRTAAGQRSSRRAAGKSRRGR